MKDNGFERGLAQQLMQELMEAQKASKANWSVVVRHDGVYVQKEKPSGEIVLFTLPEAEDSSPST